LVTIYRASVYPQPALEHLFIRSQPLDVFEACTATARSSPYSECLGCSQYVPALPGIPTGNYLNMFIQKKCLQNEIFLFGYVIQGLYRWTKKPPKPTKKPQTCKRTI